ncbi:MAG: choice-of-anchor V domain-containing protein [Bacteroidota bacterium]
MKKTLLIGFAVVTTLALSLTTLSVISYPQGAPSGVANDPLGGNSTCTDCHSGTAITATTQATITSTIPAAGYTPGTVYTVTATVTYAGRSTFGFEVSPQNSSGTKLGTLTLTSSSTTKLVGSSKYITQTQAGTTGTSGSHTWTFNWTAPAAGSGAVTFYGAFLAANGNGGSSGDQTYKTSYTVAEAVASGVNELQANTNALSVINLNSALHISYTAQSSATANVELYNLQGALVGSTSFDKQNAGNVELNFDLKGGLNTGIYIVKVQQGTQVLTKKLPLVF